MKNQTFGFIRIFTSVALCAAITSCTPPAFLGRDTAATRLGNYSVYLYNKGRFAEAVPVAENALSINEEKFGAEHLYTAESLNMLGVLYMKTGDYAKAEPLFKRALLIREKALGNKHPDTIGSLNNLALLYHSIGDDAKAEQLFKNGLQIKGKASGQ